MKRDMELIRRILLKIEETDSSELSENCFDDVDPKTVAYHFRLLDDAGFVLRTHQSHGVVFGRDLIRQMSEISYDAVHTRVIHSTRGCSIIDPALSWTGCEFLDAVRDDGVWKDVKKEASKLKSVPFEILRALAFKLVSRLVGLE